MPHPSSSATLYAWAVPAWFRDSPVDHTWVTTFDNQTHKYPTIGNVISAKKDYWYCWGDYHPVGGTPINATGALGSRNGNLALARCLVLSNADSSTVNAARGTIFSYGVDGVCHQLANQVLYATGGSAGLRVSAARGYFFSVLLYGTYGLQHAAWAAKTASCTAAVSQSPLSPGPVTTGTPKMPDLLDDFEDHIRGVLGADDAELISKVLAFRAEAQAYLAQNIPGFSPPSAETLNARNQHFIDQVAALLGPEKFEKVFGAKSGEKVDLVDPTIGRQK